MSEESKLRINHPAVIVLVVLHQILPAVWYGIFAEGWMTVWEKTEADVSNPSPWPYVYSIVGSVIKNYTTAWLYVRLDIRRIGTGVLTGCVLWLGFVFHAFWIHHAFTLIPFEATFYDAGIELINMAVAGVILSIWLKKQ